jgi:hypothetical protein
VTGLSAVWPVYQRHVGVGLLRECNYRDHVGKMHRHGGRNWKKCSIRAWTPGW